MSQINNDNYGDRQDNPIGAAQGFNNSRNQNGNSSQGNNDASQSPKGGLSGTEKATSGAEKASEGASTAGTMANNASNASGIAMKGAEAGAETAGLASGTVTGGVGTALTIAWDLRHTIVKILGCVLVIFLVFAVLFFSLPDIVYASIFGLDGTEIGTVTLESQYDELSTAIQELIDESYEDALKKAKKTIKDSGYDYDTSLLYLIDNAKNSAKYDICKILAIYSVTLESGNEPSKSDLISKLKKNKDQFFTVTSAVKRKELPPSTELTVYKARIVQRIVKKTPVGFINGVPKYTYDTVETIVFIPDGTETITETKTVYNYVPVTYEILTSNDETFTYEPTVYNCYITAGTKTVSPEAQYIDYLECTINHFNESLLYSTFNVDENGYYRDTTVTNKEVIENKTIGLKTALYGDSIGDVVPPISDSEILSFIDALNCSDTGKKILSTALSLVGKVPYFWGGKSAAGWNAEWNKPRLVTASGSSTTNTIQPYGLDCTGFTDWTFKTAVGKTLYDPDPYNQLKNCYRIDSNDIKPGDLGVLMNSDGVTLSHALIFAGYDEKGNRLWVHCTSPNGVVLNCPHYDAKLIAYRPNNFDYGD